VEGASSENLLILLSEVRLLCYDLLTAVVNSDPAPPLLKGTLPLTCSNTD